MPHVPDTKQSLILRLRHRDDVTAWQEFTSTYAPAIYRVARRHGLQDADASELVQDVLWAVAQAVGRWEPHGPAKFRSWLMRIVRNKAIDTLRRQTRQALGEGGSGMLHRLAAEPDPSEALSVEIEMEYRRELFRRAARDIQRQARASTWQAFWLTSVDGLSSEEAARRTGLSVGAVYIARSRVLARLRATVESYEKNE